VFSFRVVEPPAGASSLAACMAKTRAGSPLSRQVSRVEQMGIKPLDGRLVALAVGQERRAAQHPWMSAGRRFGKLEPVLQGVRAVPDRRSGKRVQPSISTALLRAARCRIAFSGW
jgi:hypothetical protein